MSGVDGAGARGVGTVSKDGPASGGFYALVVGMLGIALCFPLAWLVLLPAAERPPLLDPDGGFGPIPRTPLASATAAVQRDFAGDDVVTFLVRDEGTVWSAEGIARVQRVEAAVRAQSAFRDVRSPLSVPILRVTDGVVHAETPLSPASSGEPEAAAVVTVRRDPFIETLFASPDGTSSLVVARVERRGDDAAMVRLVEEVRDDPATDAGLREELRRVMDEARLAVLLGQRAGPPARAVLEALRAQGGAARKTVERVGAELSARTTRRDGGALAAAEAVIAALPPADRAFVRPFGPWQLAAGIEGSARRSLPLVFGVFSLLLVALAAAGRRPMVWPLLGSLVCGFAAAWTAAGYHPVGLLPLLWALPAAMLAFALGLRPLRGLEAGAALVAVIGFVVLLRAPAAPLGPLRPSPIPGPGQWLGVGAEPGKAYVSAFGTDGPIFFYGSTRVAGGALDPEHLRREATLERCLRDTGAVHASFSASALVARLLGAAGGDLTGAVRASVDQALLVFGSPDALDTAFDPSRSATLLQVLPKSGRVPDILRAHERCDPDEHFQPAGRVAGVQAALSRDRWPLAALVALALTPLWLRRAPGSLVAVALPLWGGASAIPTEVLCLAAALLLVAPWVDIGLRPASGAPDRRPIGAWVVLGLGGAAATADLVLVAQLGHLLLEAGVAAVLFDLLWASLRGRRPEATP